MEQQEQESGAGGVPWALWYQDLFDRETPRRVEATGVGLAAGLNLLWRRFLSEGVGDDGRPGFSHFNLWLPRAGCSVEIEGNPQGAARLRCWLREGGWEAASAAQAVARCHGRLLRIGRDAAVILALAEAATDRAEFRRRLLALYRELGEDGR